MPKCKICKKKPKPLPFKCRCGESFCIRHKDPEDHNCTYDFISHGKRKLEQDNPKVVGKKIAKI